MPTYVALLRGINVGGKNLIKMPALKECFEANGFEDVTTYIQSGNVLFSAPATRAAELTRGIETMLAEAFDYVPTVVVRNRKQLRAIVGGAPKGFGTQPATYRYDVIFLKEPLTAKAALQTVPPKPGVDTAHAARHPLLLEAYCEGHAEPAGQDHLVADLSERDDPELEHDDEAAVDDGRARLTTSAWRAWRSPGRDASGPPSSRAPSGAARRTRR